MKKLIDLTKGEKWVFVRLNNGKSMSDFLKQAEREGFVINCHLPTQCKCDKVMVLHSDYTISYLHGWALTTVYGCTKAKKVNFDEYMNGRYDSFCF
ncbi:MAG: hypothetical protein E7571_00800 [Ruminococcaceae bacterium]|nr:hypothetical protein [Oscillospiraceae bacterium]